MWSFIITLLTCSITMSVISLFYILLTPLLAKRYSVKVRYYAWLVIVIGLIIPFRPQFNNTIAKVTIPSQTIIPFVQIDNGISVEHIVTPSVKQSILWWQIAFIAWSIGVFVFFTYHIVKHYQFMKMVKRWSNIIVDGQSFIIFQSLKTEMGILKPINLCLCSCIGSPMMVGLVNPCIMLPHMNWNKDELFFIFKHELVHFKRKDLCYKILVLIAISIHWFNPIVYLIARMIDALCEMSCDVETVQDTDADTRYHYTETIIRVVKYQSKLKTALSTNFYGGKKGMKNRISSIMDTTSKRVGFIIIFVVLIATVGTGYMSNGSSQNQSNYLKENEISNETKVTFDGMKAWWDTGWADDEFFLVFKAESDLTISEYGIKCWDIDGKEIQYLDGPFSPGNETNYVNSYGYCIHAIQDNGSYSGSLVFGETYYWLGYAIVDGKRYESPTNSFVFSAEGSRFGHLVENESSNETRVIFNSMKMGWDTDWSDDKFFLTFSVESNATISEYGIECWDDTRNSNEIEYIDEPSRLGNKTNSMNNYDFCIYTIQPDGSHFGSLAIGETYNWTAYVVVNGRKYSSPHYPFVFSIEEARYGK